MLNCHMCKAKKLVTVGWMQCDGGLIYKQNKKECQKRFCTRCIWKVETATGKTIKNCCPSCEDLCLCGRCQAIRDKRQDTGTKKIGKK
jgi:hypothetical protein